MAIKQFKRPIIDNNSKNLNILRSCPAFSPTILILVIIVVPLSIFVYKLNFSYSIVRHEPLSVVYRRNWGSYRSGHYFGIKKSVPLSMVAGLMWFRNALESGSVTIRHWCNQFDHLKTYTWLKHDFNSFGIQKIVDSDINILTKLLIYEDDFWVARIKLSSINQNFKEPVSLVFYFALEDDQDSIRVFYSNDANSTKSLEVKGIHKGIPFDAFIKIIGSTKGILHSGIASMHSSKSLLNLKEDLLRNMEIVYTKNDVAGGFLIVVKKDALHNLEDKPINFIANQIITKESIEIEVQFKENSYDSTRLVEKFDKILQDLEINYDRRFESIFHLQEKGYNKNEISFAQSALSNMIGSIGYFHGFSLVQTEKENIKYGPHDLLTAVPSRSFFPRGFLWDEGFHNMIISRFNSNLSMTILSSWFNLITSNGWIPREVILGIEAEGRVPSEFIVQKPTNANPPTLFLTLRTMLDRGLLSSDYLQKLFPKLELWYNYYDITQKGSKKGSYRWRGRENTLKELNPKTLASGLDDYPRASNPSDDEIHIDLRCWMAFASKIMFEIAEMIKHPSATKFMKKMKLLYDNDLLNNLHWSSEHKMYCDYGMHSLSVVLTKKKNKNEFERVEKEPPSFQCVPEYGYVSIFPMALSILDSRSDKLGKILSDLVNPDLLWTKYGLRSLSKKSRYYNKYNTKVDPPYWRGPIWININYLVLKSLHFYSHKEGKYQRHAQDIYINLRKNIIDNVYKEYLRTGYIWEQYDDITGKGKGSHPFTGWSSLILLIMAEQY